MSTLARLRRLRRTNQLLRALVPPEAEVANRDRIMTPPGGFVVRALRRSSV